MGRRSNEAQREYMREYRKTPHFLAYKASPERKAANRDGKRRWWEAKTKDQKRDFFLRSFYSESLEWYNGRLLAQGGLCLICSLPPKPGESLMVDHDHSCCSLQGHRTCGKCTRGLICNKCNVMLGMAEDSPTILNAAIQYLAKYPKKG